MPGAGANPLYLQIVQWANIIIQNFLYPLGILIILFLAYREFRRLGNHWVPRPESERRKTEETKRNTI